jgi:hypothetical protein
MSCECNRPQFRIKRDAEVADVECAARRQWRIPSEDTLAARGVSGRMDVHMGAEHVIERLAPPCPEGYRRVGVVHNGRQHKLQEPSSRMQDSFKNQLAWELKLTRRKFRLEYGDDHEFSLGAEVRVESGPYTIHAGLPGSEGDSRGAPADDGRRRA